MNKRRIYPEDFSPLDVAFARLLPEVFDYRDVSTLAGQKYRVNKDLLGETLKHLQNNGVIQIVNEKRRIFRKVNDH